jgi:hypothetical protein
MVSRKGAEGAKEKNRYIFQLAHLFIVGLVIYFIAIGITFYALRL